MLVFDIETIPNEERIKSRQWAEFKEKKQIKDDQDSALYPAFGQVVCICAWDQLNNRKFKKCVEDERDLLLSFNDFMSKDEILAGQFIKGFDIPFLASRYIANELSLPDPFRVANKKPWEIVHIDTAELLKFGGFSSPSLDAICLMFGIQSPKEGSVNALGVRQAFKEKRFTDIEKYCSMDVMQTNEVIRILQKYGAM
jgi:predicted PolB exonuclease-like 3'-5' exonuclease